MNNQILCGCGHPMIKHFISGSLCAGSEECLCRKSQQLVFSEWQQRKLDAYEEALKKIARKSHQWIEDNIEASKVGEYKEPPYWNLGDTAKAVLKKFGEEI